ncbi:MAG TPA: c-type cytochrome [Polyangiaceae bacterium]|nr:c-type cytochrome [Polyangiaceae bacterium]
MLTSCKREASAADPPEVKHGRELYGRMCSVCHGDKGEGYKADQAPRLAQPEFLGSASDAFLRAAIRDGRRGTTMSAWAQSHGGPLTDKDIEDVVRFLRTWQKGTRVKLDESPLTGDVSRGTQLFTQRCELCHGKQGVAGLNVRIGAADFLATASDGFLRHAIKRGRPGTPMKGFESSLGKQGVDDVIAALRSFATPPPVAAPEPPKPPPPMPLGPVPMNPKGPEPHGFKLYPAMTGADVIKAEYDRKSRFAILDARAPSDYLNEHIAGAVSVPFYDPAPYLDKLPRDAWLVCYCACPHAESGQLAQRLLDAGFKKVTVLNEGLLYWKSKNYPLGRGEAKPAGDPPKAPSP